ncbi:DNA helicase-2/ATP-dependent DNA helicase PcrA [Cytobacillus eiseniae]|uniref:DNA helicase-2/ATP-dependent DNA helicase PcrA n=1 Tax=Cytobacillus eiseniae TaxID=762947 RepID=A0ABS4RKA4_9BACI|nr:RNA polymerase recycling motor HelD [Cytobacillus eiseniae]MBP2243331.1 DNA helicase-2/ATP-dependent DNA helicase PcrA [Cytobacillus eiseniae]
MSSQQHPDFEQEKQHLGFTKKYIDVVIKTAETSKDQFQENMKESFNDVDWLESSMSYLSLLTNARFFEMSRDELKHLKIARKKPYFARLDLLRDGTKEKEVLYIGKTSLYSRENQEQLIVDWRSPIANLYYEGRLGDVHYESNDETYNGYLSLKRQFMIEDGRLDEIRDIDLTTTDELLQESLAKSSSNRLTEIISTIQEEQNKIIRADLNRPIIVQGAAGSGKTTIALHRISYFIYQYKENFAPEQLMILAPSRLFIDYISEALPELGVEKVRQTTFQDYVLTAINEKLSIINDNKLIHLLENPNHKESNQLAWVSSIKGSPVFQQILTKYIATIYESFYPTEDFTVDKFRLFSKKKFIQLFKDDYNYLPLYRRLEKLKAVLQNDLAKKKQNMIKKIETYYDDRIERALYRGNDPEKRRQYVSDALDKKTLRLAEIKKAIRTALPTYMRQFPKKSLVYYYLQLFSDPTQLIHWSEGHLSEKEGNILCQYQQQLFRKKQFEREDLALMLFLQVHLFGIPKELKAKNIVIDEAQDYSYMELLSLKKALDTDMFTLVGDLAQGIHSYRGLTSWNNVITNIFPRATYTELQKSYRTTVEIMEKANELLRLLPYSFPEVVPVVRHGESPTFIKRRNGKDFVRQIETQVAFLKKESYKTIAVIGKTMKDCRLLAHLFNEFSVEPVKLLEEQEKIPKDTMVIVPSFLAKGLEFDAVMIVCLEEAFSRESELDIKLLYVAMTRPLHRLFFYGERKEDFIIL